MRKLVCTGTANKLVFNLVFIAVFALFAASSLRADTPSDTPTDIQTATETPTNTPVPAAYFDIAAPSQANASAPFYITVTARTALGAVANDYAGVVTFGSGAFLSVMPDDYGFIPSDNGVHAFLVRIMSAGDEVVNVSDIDTTSISNSTIVTILPAPASYYTLNAPSSVKAGAAFSLTLTAKDSYNNIVSNYNGTASFDSSDTSAVLPSDATFINDDGGRKVFAVTLKTKGTQTISAKDLVGSSINGSSNAINVTCGTISSFNVSAPAVANPNTSFNFAISAMDSFFNVADNYTGTVHFTSSDVAAVLPANYTFQAGDYGNRVFSATLVNSGTQTITVSDASAATITGVSSGVNVNQVFNPYAQPLMLTSYIPDAAIYQFVYMKVLTAANIQIPNNAYLEYDVFMPSYNADFYTGTDMDGTVFGDMRDYGQATQSYIIDQNGIRCHPSMDLSQYASGQWYHRKFNIAALGGSTYNELDLAQDTGNSGANGAPSNQAGTFNSFFNNIVFTNSSGTVLTNFFSSNSTIPFSGTVSLNGNVAGNRGQGGINNGPTPPPPVNNYLYIIKDMSLSSAPAGSVVADGAHSLTVTAFLFGPTNAAVPWALTDFSSDRAADSVYPVVISANAKAVTGTDGLANARITSTQSGQANITVKCAHLTKVISVNFVAGPSSKVNITPAQINTETGVQGTMSVSLEDAFGNFSSTSKNITLSSTSSTMRFSSDNGNTWQSGLIVGGTLINNVLIIDTSAGTSTISAAAAGLTPAACTAYINNAPASSILMTPPNPSSKAGVPVTMTAWAVDSSGNNAYYTNSVAFSSDSSTMMFSQDGVNYSRSLTMNMSNGRADIYCYDTKVGSNVTVTAQSAGLSNGTAYFTTMAGSAAMLNGYANNYSVLAGQSVTVTAAVTDSYGNPVMNTFVTFTAQVEGGLGDSLLTPTGNSTNASGQVVVTFRTKSTSPDINYVIINSNLLLGKTIAISGSGAAASYSFSPSPLAAGADGTTSLFVNAKDSGGFNAPAPGHGGVYVSVTYPAGSTNVFFSADSGNNWYNNVTATLDVSGSAQLLVRSHIPGTYSVVGADVNPVGTLIPASTTLTVSTAYYIAVSPSTAASANAGSTIPVTAQIVDQNGTPAAIANVQVNFSTSNGSISPATVYTDATGKAVSTLSLAIAAYAAQAVTVKSINPNSTAVSGIITSLPALSFSIAIPASAYINTPLQAVVRVKDAYGQTISNYTGTIHFTSLSAATLPLDYTFVPADAGVKYFTFSLSTAAPMSQTITAADIASPSIKGTSNVILMYLNPTPSPSISPTKTMTFTKTPTPTFTDTPTVTPTDTKTSTPTITRTWSASPTDTPSYTPTITPTFTGTLTFTVTPTVTESFTITPTWTISKTFTVSPTSTVTPTSTETWTYSPTFTVTPTSTETDTASPTYTVTDTFTDSPTATITPTVTETLTVTDTYTFTATGTYTMTYTTTPSITVTQTSSATPTMTMTLTPSATPTPYYNRAISGKCYVFPQPASQALTIVYSSDSQADMTVKIFNSAGMLAATLEAKAGISDYNYIPVSLSKFAPGVYFYILTGKKSAGGNLDFGIKKFMVAK